MSVMVTKKQLKEIAERLDAYYLGANIYNYENDVFSIQYDHNRLKLGKNENNLISKLRDYERHGKNYNFRCGQVVNLELKYKELMEWQKLVYFNMKLVVK